MMSEEGSEPGSFRLSPVSLPIRGVGGSSAPELCSSSWSKESTGFDL